MASNNSNCDTPVHSDECGYARRFAASSSQYIWNWSDEPNLGGDADYTKYSVDNDPYWGLHEWHEAVKAVDTDHPTLNTFTAITNEFGKDLLIRDYQYAYYFNNDTTVCDIWMIDYYPYEYRLHDSKPDLEQLAVSVDNIQRYNFGLIPVWVMGESEDLRDYYGYIGDYWRASTYEPIQKQIVEAGRLYRHNDGTSCTTGTVEPTWSSADEIGETVTDNTCVWECEGTHTNRVLDVASWDSGEFQVGERVCASVTDGGCATVQGVIGRPRQGGSFTQTAASYIRTPEALDNYQINQLVLSSKNGTGTFTDGMHLVGQTSGATCTLATPTLYRLGPWSTEKSYDWTPHPTPQQIANAIWIPIIHGARGVAYFPLFTYITDENKVEMAAQLAKLTALKDIILEGMSDKIAPANYQQWAPATVASGYRVDYTIRDYVEEVWIFAARLKTKSDPVYPWPDPTDTNAIPATIPLDYLVGSETITVYGEGRTITADADGFTDNFTDYDVHIYSVGAEDAPSYALTVTLAGAGTGTVTSSPAAIYCGSTCTGNFVEDSVITLTATPTGADTFTGWSGGGCSGTDPCAVTMDEAQSVTATFATAVPPDHIVTISHTGTGTGATDPIAGEHIYAEEAEVTVTQTPTDENMTFAGWSGTCGCTGTNGCSFNMPENDCTVIATWTADSAFNLIVDRPTHGEVVTSDVGGINCGGSESEPSQLEVCSAKFYEDTVVTLTTTTPGDRFSMSYIGGCTGEDCVLTMDEDKIVGVTTTNGYDIDQISGMAYETGGVGVAYKTGGVLIKKP